MANELTAVLSQTGLTVSARLYLSGAAVGPAIAAAETSPGLYVASVPAGTAAGSYVVIFTAAGAPVATGQLHWLGERELDPKSLDDLHLIHGLRTGASLVVTPASRSFGGISQTIEQNGDTVTVRRI